MHVKSATLPDVSIYIEVKFVIDTFDVKDKIFYYRHIMVINKIIVGASALTATQSLWSVHVFKQEIHTHVCPE